MMQTWSPKSHTTSSTVAADPSHASAEGEGQISDIATKGKIAKASKMVEAAARAKTKSCRGKPPTKQRLASDNRLHLSSDDMQAKNSKSKRVNASCSKGDVVSSKPLGQANVESQGKCPERKGAAAFWNFVMEAIRGSESCDILCKQFNFMPREISKTVKGMFTEDVMFALRNVLGREVTSASSSSGLKAVVATQIWALIKVPGFAAAVKAYSTSCLDVSVGRPPALKMTTLRQSEVLSMLHYFGAYIRLRETHGDMPVPATSVPSSWKPRQSFLVNDGEQSESVDKRPLRAKDRSCPADRNSQRQSCRRKRVTFAPGVHPERKTARRKAVAKRTAAATGTKTGKAAATRSREATRRATMTRGIPGRQCETAEQPAPVDNASGATSDRVSARSCAKKRKLSSRRQSGDGAASKFQPATKSLDIKDGAVAALDNRRCNAKTTTESVSDITPNSQTPCTGVVNTKLPLDEDAPTPDEERLPTCRTDPSKVERKFKVGQIVWCRGFGPLWPARVEIVEADDAQDSTPYAVKFYGETTCAWVAEGKLHDWDSRKPQQLKLLPQRWRTRMAKAIEEAQSAADAAKAAQDANVVAEAAEVSSSMTVAAHSDGCEEKLGTETSSKLGYAELMDAIRSGKIGDIKAFRNAAAALESTPDGSASDSDSDNDGATDKKNEDPSVGVGGAQGLPAALEHREANAVAAGA
eukprot:TRINITY_DN57026_c0_g1_i1.p1 TRINITY_DN57026_c0_g1~~TRINITY_DN57026_c0_g1_i1.p1  ORF type:complete len:698 (-),score=98.21 TRINITY_DN57026_c0_g1_i1:252-2345(-)